MVAWLDHVGIFLWDTGVSALVLLAVASLGMLGTRQPARRLMIARAAVLGVLAILPLEACRLLPRFDPVALARQATPVDAPDSPPETPTPAPAPTPVGHEPDAVPVWVARSLTALYLAGVAGGLAWLALGRVGLLWVSRRSSPPAPAAMAVYDELRPPGTKRPRLRVTSRVRRPVVVGLFRPMILIPPDLDPTGTDVADEPAHLVSDRLRLGLLHELAHAEAGDPWFTAATHLAEALYFVLPPLWWVASRMRLDQEVLADRRAALSYGTCGSYASALVDYAAEGVADPDPAPRDPSLVPLEDAPAHSSDLVHRVLMLLRCPFPVEQRPPGWWSRGLPGIAVLVTFLASCLSVRPGEALPAPLAISSAPGSFRVVRLDLPARPADPKARPALFELPLRLPEHFDLTVEVLGDLASLAATRVVGVPLALPADALAAADPPRWHPVRLHRDHHGLTLEVDGRTVTAPDPAGGLTDWLSLEAAPGREGHFRSLRIAW